MKGIWELSYYLWNFLKPKIIPKLKLYFQKQEDIKIKYYAN